VRDELRGIKERALRAPLHHYYIIQYH